MKTGTAVIVFFIVLILSTVVIYKALVNFKIKQEIEKHNKICAFLTQQLNEQRNENNTCVSYYCYYKPYAPPKGLEKTSTLCVCDCKLENGTVVKIQVLSA